ncbi:MAG: DUF456 domain-containing protein [Acidobacteriota bacterium]
MPFLGHLLLFLGMLAGLLMIPFGLPGVAAMFLCAVAYAVVTEFEGAIGVGFFLVLCCLTVAAETADNWLMALGAKKFGASRGAVWISLLGGLLGGLLLGPPLMLLTGFLGPFFGAFLGAFLLVFAYELLKERKQTGAALRAGWGTIVGRMAGIGLKMMIGIGMFVAIWLSILTH